MEKIQTKIRMIDNFVKKYTLDLENRIDKLIEEIGDKKRVMIGG